MTTKAPPVGYIIKHLNKWVPSKGVQKSFAAIVWERKKFSLHFWQSLGSWQDSPKRRHPPPKKRCQSLFLGDAMSVPSGQNFGENLPPHWVFCLHNKRNKKKKTEGFFTEMNYLTRECWWSLIRERTQIITCSVEYSPWFVVDVSEDFITCVLGCPWKLATIAAIVGWFITY